MHPAIADKRDELAALCRRYGVTRLQVFGSAAAPPTSIRSAATPIFSSSSIRNARPSPWSGISISGMPCKMPSAAPSISSNPSQSATLTCEQLSTAPASWSMPRDPRILLADIEQAAADIANFLEGMTREDYTGDNRTQAAVERKFEIIGEALNRVHADHPRLAHRIPQLRHVIDFRNLLSHGYERVLSDRVWNYAQHDLPVLIRIVHNLLAEFGPPPN